LQMIERKTTTTGRKEKREKKKKNRAVAKTGKRSFWDLHFSREGRQFEATMKGKQPEGRGETGRDE